MNLPLAATLGALACASPAIAQSPADALTALMMEACIFETASPSVDELTLEDAGFAAAGLGDGTAAYAAPSGATLDYATREGFASCEMRLPDAAALFAPVSEALSAAIAARDPAARAEQAGGTMTWSLPAQDGALTRTRLEVAPDGALRLVSATEMR